MNKLMQPSEEMNKLCAFQTLVEMCALLGEPMMINNQVVDQDSVAVWSKSLVVTSISFNDPGDGYPPQVDSSCDEQKVGVRFQPTVSVVEIPSHRDMCQDAKDRLWTDSDTTLEKGMQNAMEWHTDGKDWRNAPEEDQMIWDPQQKDFIHPFTWQKIQEEAEREAALKEEWKRWEALEREYHAERRRHGVPLTIHVEHQRI